MIVLSNSYSSQPQLSWLSNHTFHPWFFLRTYIYLKWKVKDCLNKSFPLSPQQLLSKVLYKRKNYFKEHRQYYPKCDHLCNVLFSICCMIWQFIRLWFGWDNLICEMKTKFGGVFCGRKSCEVVFLITLSDVKRNARGELYPPRRRERQMKIRLDLFTLERGRKELRNVYKLFPTFHQLWLQFRQNLDARRAHCKKIISNKLSTLAHDRNCRIVCTVNWNEQ